MLKSPGRCSSSCCAKTSRQSLLAIAARTTNISHSSKLFHLHTKTTSVRCATSLVTRRSLVIPRSTSSPMSSSSPASANKKIGVLFVCLGNICRSPTAEAMFRAVVERNGMSNKFDIDSCGTGGGNSDWYYEGGWSYHEGDAADSRMTATAKKRGVNLTSRSRPLQPLDLSRFDYVIGMDSKNIRAVQTAANYWASRPSSSTTVPADYQGRLSLMTSYCSKFKGAPEVPDPYYGGSEGFEKVLDLLEDACQGLLDTIKREKGV